MEEERSLLSGFVTERQVDIDGEVFLTLGHYYNNETSYIYILAPYARIKERLVAVECAEQVYLDALGIKIS